MYLFRMEAVTGPHWWPNQDFDNVMDPRSQGNQGRLGTSPPRVYACPNRGPENEVRVKTHGTNITSGMTLAVTESNIKFEMNDHNVR